MSRSLQSSDLVYFSEHGAGPPLLLVHGLMVSGEMFDPIVGEFATRHRVIIPDLRGHGRSRGLPPPYSVSQLAADLARLLDHVGISTIAVLGYSQGGAVAQQFAIDYPQRCSRLVLACTYAFNRATFREKLEGHLMPLLLNLLGTRGLAKLVISQGAKQLDPKRGQWLAGMMADQDRALMLAAWREAMAFDSRHRLAEINCPTLILAAANDRAVPSHHAQMLYAGIAYSKLITVDGADHTLIWTHPGNFVRTTEDFLLGSV